MFTVQIITLFSRVLQINDSQKRFQVCFMTILVWNLFPYLLPCREESHPASGVLCTKPIYPPLQGPDLITNIQRPERKAQLSSAPLSFNTPNTSAWNNCTNTSHCWFLACCLVCLSYLLSWNLTSPHWDLEPFCYHIPTGYCRIAADWAVQKTALLGVILSKSFLLTTLSWSLLFRNWYLSSSTSQRCLSTAMATV